MAVLVAIIGSIDAIVCPPNYCQKISCANSMSRDACKDKNGIFNEHAEGQSCGITLLKGVPPKAQCAPGLRCNTTSLTCVEINM
ncbi:unnamed protein product [Medioppia subpectinata]|uniref:Uncharacterized protein n=1 Tax=Medioppia subpectinata TaxID=1979941 RepID=A0A7R9L5G9_9ACAR|nr:unnamed protein product [Medioppia subpectinata]CAG2115872.1 unnamed protein product [Medioppia subpectinata]